VLGAEVEVDLVLTLPAPAVVQEHLLKDKLLE
jgi:hypothetical protein